MEVSPSIQNLTLSSLQATLTLTKHDAEIVGPPYSHRFSLEVNQQVFWGIINCDVVNIFCLTSYL